MLEQLRRSNPEPSLDALDDNELALIFSTLEETRLSTTTTRTPQRTPRTRGPRGWFKPALAFGSALVLVLVAIGGGLLLLRGTALQPAAEPTTTVPQVATTTPASTTEAPTTTAAPATTPQAVPPLDPGAAWEVVVSGGETPTMAVAFIDGIGWIAVGGPYVMVSQNSAEWVKADTAGVILNNAAFLSGVVAGGPGALAYGRTCEGGGDFGYEPFPCPQEPALFSSTDGLTWERVTSDAFHGCVDRDTAECYAGITDLGVTTNGSLIAAGPDPTTRDGIEAAPYVTESAVWSSTDGESWQRHDIALNAIVPDGWNAGSESLGQFMHTNDRWLAFFSVWRWLPDDEFEEGYTILLESSDGSDWRIIDTGDTFLDAGPDDVVAGPNGLLAIGGQTTWWSTDGQEWVQSTIPGENWFDRAIALDSGFIVYNREGDPAFAFTRDGIEWTAFAGDDDLGGVGWNEIAGIDVTADAGDGISTTLVGVGYHGLDYGEDESDGGPPEPVIMRWSGVWSG
jgi:hypothetical protein